jgi:hypothetical protein
MHVEGLTDDRDGEGRQLTMHKENQVVVEAAVSTREIEAEPIAIEFDGDFDEERAKRALIAARAAEKAARRKAAARIAALEKELAQANIVALEKELALLSFQKKVKAKAEKSLELELAAAQARIAELEQAGQARIVHDDTAARATARG